MKVPSFLLQLTLCLRLSSSLVMSDSQDCSPKPSLEDDTASPRATEAAKDTETSLPEGASAPIPQTDSSEDEEETMSASLLQKLSRLFAGGLKLHDDEDKDVVKRLKEPTVDGIIEYIKSDACKNIVVMVGAGISTSAGIPDFRSPGSGLYDNLQQYKLPSPECMFDINFFRSNPEPFFHLSRQLIPEDLKPTPCHYFLRLLHEKGLLLRTYSQNIDNLESVAGLPDDKIVAAHGSFHTSHCLHESCRKEYDYDWIREKIKGSNEVPKCEKCAEVVKPDIVFFGERLPARFFSLSEEDFPSCDLLIVIGTSLTVQPFASLIELVPRDVPRLAINLTPFKGPSRYEKLMGLGSGWDFDSKDNYRDVFMKGLCDDKCNELAKLLGWEEDLKRLIENK